MNKIKPNMTVGVVAAKNRSKIPAEVDTAFTVVNKTIDTVGQLTRIPDVIKSAKVAKVAREQLEAASASLVAYRAKLEDDKAEFIKTIDDLTVPNGQIEMMEHSSLRTQLLSGNQQLKEVVYLDPTVAGVAYRLPPEVKKKMKLDDNILREVMFKGFNEEIARYDSLLENADRAQRHLDSELQPLIDEDAEASLAAFQSV